MHRRQWLQKAARFHFQIFIDGVGAEGAGGGFDDEHPFGAQAGEDFMATLDDFLGGGGLEHLHGGAGLAGGGRADLGVVEDDEKNQVAAGKIDGRIGNVGAASAVSHFGDPEDEAAATLELAEAGGGAEMVGLRAFHAGHRKRIDHHAQRGCAGGGQKLLLDCAAINHEASLVAGLRHGLREGEACAASLIELGEAEEEGFVRGSITESWGGGGPACG
jgi:hypothetical protein